MASYCTEPDMEAFLDELVLHVREAAKHGSLRVSYDREAMDVTTFGEAYVQMIPGRTRVFMEFELHGPLAPAHEPPPSVRRAVMVR